MEKEVEREGKVQVPAPLPPSIFPSRSLSLLSLLALSFPLLPCAVNWGRVSVDEVCVCLFRVQGYTSWQCITIGGTAPEGSACAFPFTYGGAAHYSCTTINNFNVPWCSTNGVDCNVVDPCSWGNCNCTRGSGPCLACEAGELRRGIMSDVCCARARACVRVYVRATSCFLHLQKREKANAYHSARRALMARHIQGGGRQRLMPTLPRRQVRGGRWFDRLHQLRGRKVQGRSGRQHRL